VLQLGTSPTFALMARDPSERETSRRSRESQQFRPGSGREPVHRFRRARPRKSVEFDFDEHELRGDLREALFDGLPALVEFDAVDPGVARQGGDKASHAFA